MDRLVNSYRTRCQPLELTVPSRWMVFGGGSGKEGAITYRENKKAVQIAAVVDEGGIKVLS